jgi:DNA-directed RNA polymerase III subunit RPC1
MNGVKHGGSGSMGGSSGGGGIRGERRNPLVKQFVLENDRPAKISHLNFGLLSEIDMMRMSEIKVHSK